MVIENNYSAGICGKTIQFSIQELIVLSSLAQSMKTNVAQSLERTPSFKQNSLTELYQPFDKAIILLEKISADVISLEQASDDLFFVEPINEEELTEDFRDKITP